MLNNSKSNLFLNPYIENTWFNGKLARSWLEEDS